VEWLAMLAEKKSKGALRRALALPSLGRNMLRASLARWRGKRHFANLHDTARQTFFRTVRFLSFPSIPNPPPFLPLKARKP
jgi:hypothetical protein